jgi:hypothetical protein
VEPMRRRALVAVASALSRLFGQTCGHASAAEDQAAASAVEDWKPAAHVATSARSAESALHTAKRDHCRDNRPALRQAPAGAGRVSGGQRQADRGGRGWACGVVGPERARQGRPAPRISPRAVARRKTEASPWGSREVSTADGEGARRVCADRIVSANAHRDHARVTPCASHKRPLDRQAVSRERLDPDREAGVRSKARAAKPMPRAARRRRVAERCGPRRPSPPGFQRAARGPGGAPCRQEA